MRRIAGWVIAGIGVIVIIVGIISGLAGKTDARAVATAKGGEAAFIFTDPGVLDLVNSTVEVTATDGSDVDITVAFGAADDVAAWADGVTATKVTGLSDWQNLATEAVTGEAEVSPDALAKSDLWIETSTEKGSFTKQYQVSQKGSVALIATSSDGTAPDIKLTWDRKQASRNLLPVIAIGILTVVIGGALVLSEVQDRRQADERRAVRARKLARRSARAEAETTILSLEEIRGASRETQVSATGGALGAGVLPSSARASELRERPLGEADRIVLPVPPKEPDVVLNISPSDTGALEETGGTLGAGVIPVSPKAGEFRSRPLADADRVVLADPSDIDDPAPSFGAHSIGRPLVAPKREVSSETAKPASSDEPTGTAPEHQVPEHQVPDVSAWGVRSTAADGESGAAGVSSWRSRWGIRDENKEN